MARPFSMPYDLYPSSGITDQRLQASHIPMPPLYDYLSFWDFVSKNEKPIRPRALDADSQWAMMQAACGGDVRDVEWLMSHDRTYLDMYAAAAAWYGHKHLLDWCLSKELDWRDTWAVAAATGNRVIFVWLETHLDASKHPDENQRRLTCMFARTEAGQEMYEWMVSRGWPDLDALKKSKSSGPEVVDVD